MIHSMTGFGRAAGRILDREVTVEMRSVNSRFREVGVRLPKSYQVLDDPVSLEERAFDLGELATRWDVSRETVRGLVDVGELRAVDVAGGSVPRWRVFERWVREFERRRSNLGSIRSRVGSAAPAGPTCRCSGERIIPGTWGSIPTRRGSSSIR